MITFPVSQDCSMVWSPSEAGYYIVKRTKDEPVVRSVQVFLSRYQAVLALNIGLVEWEPIGPNMEITGTWFDESQTIMESV